MCWVLLFLPKLVFVLHVSWQFGLLTSENFLSGLWQLKRSHTGVHLVGSPKGCGFNRLHWTTLAVSAPRRVWLRGPRPQEPLSSQPPLLTSARRIPFHITCLSQISGSGTAGISHSSGRLKLYCLYNKSFCCLIITLGVNLGSYIMYTHPGTPLASMVKI